VENKRIGFKATLVAAALCAAAPAALAATVTDTFQVTATVLSVCSVTATDLAFGNYDASSGTPNDATSTVSATCTPSETYDIAIDVGSGSGATFANRKMTSGANTLNYSLYTTAARTTIWGDGTGGTATQAGTGNGAAQNLTVYGRIPVGQYVAAGSYVDTTVTVTLTY
jgi:spore coat protein U-like protein